MDKEESKMGLKRKSKSGGASLDSDDDEPIGALLKLKGKRNSKKTKLAVDATGNEGCGVEELGVGDDKSGGMDDTLANFRKKLRGPKKDGGSAVAAKKDFSSNIGELLCQSINESAKDSKMDLSLTSEAQKRSLVSSGDDGSHGNATVTKGLKVNTRTKRSKVSLDKMEARDSEIDDAFDCTRSGNDVLPKEKEEGASEPEDESLEGSLSVLFQKVQSGKGSKSRGSSRLRQGMEAKTSDDGPKNKSSAGLEAPFQNSQPATELSKKFIMSVDNCCISPIQDSIKSPGNSADKNQALSSSLPDSVQISRSTNGLDHSSSEVINENSVSASLVQISPSGLRACSGKIYGVGDGKGNSTAMEAKSGSTNEPLESEDILGGNTQSMVGIEKINNDVKQDCKVDADSIRKCSDKVQHHSPPFELNGPQEELLSADHDGPIIVVGNCFKKMDPTVLSSQDADDDVSECRSSPASASEHLKYVVAFRKREDGSQKGVDRSEHDVEASDILPEGECPANNLDDPSDGEAINGTSYTSATLDHQGSSAEDRESPVDLENNESNLSVGQRTVRNIRKHRHEDMAYDDDIDWDVLMQSQELFASVGKAREKLNSPSTLSEDADPGKAAAAAVGLKSRVGPLEKIKFKEMLKRKGGKQEYLECRNHILRVWNKDVGSILRLKDFDVSDTPLVGESSRASLIRDIFTFLDQYGYINFGVPSRKKVDKCINHDLKLQTGDMFDENSALPIADSEDGVSNVLGKEGSPDTCLRGKNNGTSDDGNLAGKMITEDGLVNLEALVLSAPSIPEGCSHGDGEGIKSFEHMTLEEAPESEYLGSILSNKDKDSQPLSFSHPGLQSPDEEACGGPVEKPKESTTTLSASNNCAYNYTHLESGSRKSVIVVGAGPAGLIAARHLQRQGFNVTVLEARSRIGGRVFTDRSSLSVPVDLGASIITGVEADVKSERRPDPSALLCAQLGLELTVLHSDCPLYDTVTGQIVPADLDKKVETDYNTLIHDMDLLADEKGDQAMQMSLEDGLEYCLQKKGKMEDENRAKGHEDYDAQANRLNPLERRTIDWHFAHLEYGCAAPLKEVSLPHWNQDDEYGGFGGAHCMIKGGYSAVVESVAEGVPIHLDHVVTDISYGNQDHVVNNKLHKRVKVSTSNGKEFFGDAVLITVPLGCLKAESINFSPPLPEWKNLAIKRLGFGVLNKIVLEFPEVFWDDDIDFFGATAEDRDQRGRCFMFWNVKKTVGAPVLIAVLAGKAAIDGQDISSSDHVCYALLVLRKLFGEDKVPDPITSVVTNWGRDPYSYGAYSYVAVGSSGEDYDLLGRPVENCLFFAGEATCKENPDTVGGAMISGLREAVRIIDILITGTDYTAEVEAIEATRRHLDIGRNEVKDIISRLEGVHYSSSAFKQPLDGSQISTWGSLLKELFFSAKTRAGRLRLAKELLNLPVGFLKSFASTKEGLSTLNSWILDSMGKNGTQLLRHCVCLLVLVSNDLLAVRLSGIGKTVKEKVCVHTSRDIRAIASQLVNVWVELFRKEKASKGLKLLRHQNPDSKSKSPPVSGKPPLRTHHTDSKGSSKVSANSSASTKKAVDETVEPKTKNYANSDVQPSNSQGSAGNRKDQDDHNHEVPMSEEEKAAFAAAEAARATAIAAAKAYASGAMQNASRPAPKILSFHKFAMQEQHVRMDDFDSRKNWTGAAVGTQDCLSEIDSRNCRVRDWTVDFSATGVHLESSKMSADNRSQRSHSNEIANQLNVREHSGENLAVDSSILTRAWVHNAGSIGIKDYNAVERWQCQAVAASSGYSHGTMHMTDEEESNMSSKFSKQKQDAQANESSASQVSIHRELKGKQHRGGADRIKQSVVDYVATLLMPLYKARKIDRDGYKYIMKKTATKVMEQATDAEKAMAVHNFLDFKRKNKIRAFVDTLIERHMAKKPDARPGSSEKD